VQPAEQPYGPAGRRRYGIAGWFHEPPS
jgi:hypothetical protein